MHVQLVTFELPLAKLWQREPGQIDHVNDVEYRENFIECGQTTTMPLGYPHTIDSGGGSTLSSPVGVVLQTVNLEAFFYPGKELLKSVMLL